MLTKVQGLTYGTDPEGFLMRDGKIVGSEKALPKVGLGSSWDGGKVVLDGVQFELNPVHGYDFAHLAINVENNFRSLKNHLAKTPEITCCWKGVVEVSRKELDSLSEESRILGCQPSLNYWGEFPIKVNAKTYRKRSAGGHVHFGMNEIPTFYNESIAVDERKRIVPLCDLAIGNTCVLIDRDMGEVIRRRNYGRAGEFRIQPHGLEYRTLSNFWLRNYSLMDFVFGMSDIAASMLYQSLRCQHDFIGDVKREVDFAKVFKAINTNNYDMARENFEAFWKVVVDHLPNSHLFPLNKWNVGKFLTFTEGVRDKGIEAYFPDDPINHWSGVYNKAKFADFLGRIA